ncbi:MAG: hypothetical protein CMH24_00320 [Nitrosomonadales bacterium]|nr:hypothetical protein [Nitrosomonadales bacterium]
MELLAYTLAVFGFFMMGKGIKPTVEWINNVTNKDLARAIAFIAIFLTLCFYLFSTINYLLSF